MVPNLGSEPLEVDDVLRGGAGGAPPGREDVTGAGGLELALGDGAGGGEGDEGACPPLNLPKPPLDWRFAAAAATLPIPLGGRSVPLALGLVSATLYTKRSEFAFSCISWHTYGVRRSVIPFVKIARSDRDKIRCCLRVICYSPLESCCSRGRSTARAIRSSPSKKMRTRFKVPAFNKNQT